MNLGIGVTMNVQSYKVIPIVDWKPRDFLPQYHFLKFWKRAITNFGKMSPFSHWAN